MKERKRERERRRERRLGAKPKLTSPSEKN
jgi:hypothetical protein